MKMKKTLIKVFGALASLIAMAIAAGATTSFQP